VRLPGRVSFQDASSARPSHGRSRQGQERARPVNVCLRVPCGKIREITLALTLCLRVRVVWPYTGDHAQ
jgi:hypothetical protein